MRIGAKVVLGLSLALALAAPGTADAARRGLVVRTVADAPVTAARAEEALTAAVRAAGDEAIVDPLAVARARVASGAVERARLADFGRARELAREGWRAYLKVDPTFAEAQLVNARRTILAVLDLDGALDLLADVSLRLGAVRLNTGRIGDAQAAFALAFALDPERELLAREFAPAVIAAYRQAAAGGGAGVALELVVDADVELELDGAPVGRGARTLRVAVGEHVLVARARGKHAAGLIVSVPAAGTRVELPLEVDALAAALGEPAPLAIGDGERQAARLVDAAGTYADLDDVVLVVVTWRGGQPALLGQRCGLAPLRCGAVREVRFPSIARLASAVAQLVRDLAAPGGDARTLGPIVLEDTRATEPEPPSAGRGKPGGDVADARRPWWKNPWLWAGVGAVGIVAGGAAVLLADEDAASYEFTFGPLAP